MSYSGIERRRAPRIAPSESRKLLLATTVPVQVVDVSPRGLQLVSKFPLAVGDRGELRTSIGTEPVRVAVEICRVTVENVSLRGGARYRAGGVFGPMSIEQQVRLTQSLTSEPS